MYIQLLCRGEHATKNMIQVQVQLSMRVCVKLCTSDLILTGQSHLAKVPKLNNFDSKELGD